MYKTKYLIRLDDACPYMDAMKWQRMEDILDKYGVRPLVGIIPANADSQTMIDEEDSMFWKKVHQWINKGWAMALHGYDHVCISENGLNGINPVWKRSEFAGVPLERQCEKIRKGLAILRANGIYPNYFFAPSHTFDENTLIALQQESDIRIISDTYSLKPYLKNGFSYIPCQLGSPKPMLLPGLFTICLHPNSMNDGQFDKLNLFLKENQTKILAFDVIGKVELSNMRVIDRLAQMAFFLKRGMRRKKL